MLVALTFCWTAIPRWERSHSGNVSTKAGDIHTFYSKTSHMLDKKGQAPQLLVAPHSSRTKYYGALHSSTSGRVPSR